MESQKDLTRTPVWDFNKAKFDFWEHGRVEIPKFEDFKVGDSIAGDGMKLWNFSDRDLCFARDGVRLRGSG